MKTEKVWAIIPAAGHGARMTATQPKQYLSIAGQSILHHTLGRICANAVVDQVVLGLSPDDQYWTAKPYVDDKLVATYMGGATRAETVSNGVEKVRQLGAALDDWVLVHDAARPCVSDEEIVASVTRAKHNGCGAIVALPVSDTLKQVDNHHIVATQDRSRLWRALTPQVFRLSILSKALSDVLAAGHEVTDEAQAVEQSGQVVEVVQGSVRNIKVTYHDDLALAQLYLYDAVQQHERGDQ